MQTTKDTNREDSPGVGNGSLLQYSSPENSMDREAWQATATKSQRVSMTGQPSMQTHR